MILCKLIIIVKQKTLKKIILFFEYIGVLYIFTIRVNFRNHYRNKKRNLKRNFQRKSLVMIKIFCLRIFTVKIKFWVSKINFYLFLFYKKKKNILI